MRATIILSAAFAGLLAASPAPIPQDLDLGQLEAAPTVATGPSPGSLNQDVEVVSQVEVKEVATAGSSRRVFRRGWDVIPGYNNTWFCQIYKTCTTSAAAPAAKTTKKHPKKTTTKHAAKTTPMRGYAATTLKPSAKKTIVVKTTTKKAKKPKKTTMATSTTEKTKKPVKKTSSAQKATPTKKTRSRKTVKPTASWASPIQRHTSVVSPIIRHTSSTSIPAPVSPIIRHTIASSAASVSPGVKNRKTTTQLPGYNVATGYGAVPTGASSSSSASPTNPPSAPTTPSSNPTTSPLSSYATNSTTPASPTTSPSTSPTSPRFLGSTFIPGPYNPQACTDYASSYNPAASSCTTVEQTTPIGSGSTYTSQSTSSQSPSKQYQRRAESSGETKSVHAYYLNRNGQGFGTVCALYSREAGEGEVYSDGVEKGDVYEVVESKSL
ncbi:hypothetical protein KVT40_006581 [Elsinoe batatas]|uniref:Uncharacterized protein n=1 Tax=Elsinoe batatas TaxID=2601811 RepID=A0A8K0KZJ5_9PEZI|nr:hypothetical protein KVT40_006581 [Elsinoe batatas]